MEMSELNLHLFGTASDAVPASVELLGELEDFHNST